MRAASNWCMHAAEGCSFNVKKYHLFCFLYFLFHMEVGTVILNMHSLESAQDSLNKHGNCISIFYFILLLWLEYVDILLTHFTKNICEIPSF